MRAIEHRPRREGRATVGGPGVVADRPVGGARRSLLELVVEPTQA